LSESVIAALWFSTKGPDLFVKAFIEIARTRFENLLSRFRRKVLEHVVDVAIHYLGVFIVI